MTATLEINDSTLSQYVQGMEDDVKKLYLCREIRQVLENDGIIVDSVIIGDVNDKM